MNRKPYPQSSRLWFAADASESAFALTHDFLVQVIWSQNVVEIFPHSMSARKRSSSARIKDKTPHVLAFDGVVAWHVFGIRLCARRFVAKEHRIAAGGVVLVLVLDGIVVGVGYHGCVRGHRR